MTEWMCAECGTRLSANAKHCAFCGHEPDGLPVVVQRAPVARTWEFDDSCTELDRVLIDSALSKSSAGGVPTALQRALRLVPEAHGLADNLRQAPLLVADITAEKAAALAEGTLRFSRDKNGGVLAELVDSRARYDSKVRLKEVASPDAGATLHDLRVQAALSEVLDRLSDIEHGLASIVEALEDDRLARLDSAWEQLVQASAIQDSRTREQKILLAASQATQARAELARSLGRNLREIDHPTAKVNRQKKVNATSSAAFRELSALMRATQIEVVAHVMLGEPMAAQRAMEQQLTFTKTNRLDQRDRLLEIASANAESCEAEVAAYIEFLPSLRELATGGLDPTPEMTEGEQDE